MVQEPYDLHKGQRRQEKPLSSVHLLHRPMKEDLVEKFVSNGSVMDPNQPRRLDLPWPLEANDRESLHKSDDQYEQNTCCDEKKATRERHYIAHSKNKRHAAPPNAKKKTRQTARHHPNYSSIPTASPKTFTFSNIFL